MAKRKTQPARNSRRKKTKVVGSPPTMKFNKVETTYIHALTNPFDELAVGAMIPDSYMEKTIPLTCEMNGNISAGTGLKFAVQCNPYHSSTQFGPTVDMTNGTSSTKATVTTVYANKASDVFEALSALSYRVVGMGLKVWCTASDDDNAGVLVGGLCDRSLIESGDWPDWTQVKASIVDPVSMESRDGMTVRWAPASREDEDFHASTYHTNYTTDGYFLPTIHGEGVEATASYFFQAIFHLEAKIAQDLPFQTSISPYSARLDQIRVACHGQPIVVRGHSFFSFIRKALPIVQRIDKGLGDVASVINTARNFIQKVKS